MRQSLMAMLLLAAPVFAEPYQHAHSHNHDHDHANENQEAHTHGEVLLQLVADQQELVVAMASPAVNFLGFEHAVQSDAERQAVQAMEQRLNKVASWLNLRGGDCTAVEVQVDASALSGANAHADITLTAQFSCAAPAKLTGVELTLFKHFPEIEKITLEWMVSGKQGRATLTARNNRAQFH
jgi:Protein of unknown function (DUF2796).